MKTNWLKQSLYSPLTWLTIVGLTIGSYVWFVETVEIKWAALAFILVFIALGLGTDGLIRAVQIDKRMNDMHITLTRIEDSLEEMKKEQKEQPSVGSTIIPTLQTFSQLYIDYLSKQKSGEEKQKEESNETEIT